MTVRWNVRELSHRIFGSPERDRLASAITEAWIDLDRQIQKATDADRSQLTAPWVRAAYRLLLDADRHLAALNLQSGWSSLEAALRVILLNAHEVGRTERAAVALRHEADKIGGWRAKAIKELICTDDGKVRPDLNTAEGRSRVADALAIRDDFFNTTYFKITLLRRHLFQLFLLIWFAVLACLVLSDCATMPPPLNDPKLLSAVVLFGILGAVVSLARSLMSTDVSAKIPAQQIGAFLVWMRPGIGAAMALISLVLLEANAALKLLDLSSFDPRNRAVVMFVAFAAGFSERFIVGAIERVLGDKESKAGPS